VLFRSLIIFRHTLNTMNTLQKSQFSK